MNEQAVPLKGPGADATTDREHQVRTMRIRLAISASVLAVAWHPGGGIRSIRRISVAMSRVPDRKVPLIADRPELSELGRYIVEDTMLSLPFLWAWQDWHGKPLYAFTSIEKVPLCCDERLPLWNQPANKATEFGASVSNVLQASARENILTNLLAP
jgi:hypothetical protein